MVTEKRLTEKDKIAYSAISKFIKENGYPPSVRELCKIMGKSSTATIKYRLKSLEQKGFIKTTSGAKRTIRILNGAEHGHWSILSENCCVCSVCHKHSIQDYHYCPECGAYMRGK